MSSDISSQVSPVSGSQGAGVSTSAQSGASVQGTPSGGADSFNASVSIGSMNELKIKAPKVYKSMMNGIATHIINEMKDAAARFKKIIKDGNK